MFDYVSGLESVKIDYVLVTDRHKTARNSAMADLLLDDIDEALRRKVDLVLEAAPPGLLASAGPRILTNSDLCRFSCSALAEPAVEIAIRKAAVDGGRRLFVPHSAILGLDGLVDGRNQIETVVVTTTKSGASPGQIATATGTLFDGSTCEACPRFPRDVNVHAAVALA